MKKKLKEGSQAQEESFEKESNEEEGFEEEDSTQD